MKWIGNIVSLLIIIFLVVVVYRFTQSFFPTQEHTAGIIDYDTIFVTKIDTIVMRDIQVRKVPVPKPVPVTKLDTIRDTVYLTNDSTYYSSVMFDTKFEKIKVGAFADSPVDSFTFENFPKPVIFTDTVYHKEKLKLKEGLLWGAAGLVIGVIIAK